jgi:hypothetical protein
MANKNILQKLIICLFPLGIIGLYVGVVSMYFWILFMGLFALYCNKTEIGLFLIFIGTSLFGRIFGTEFLIILSTVVFSLIGLFLLREEIWKVIIINSKTFVAYSIFILYFVLMYFLGYNNEYTQLKILKLVTRGIIWFIAFLIFVQSPNISYSRLSIFFMSLALFYLSQSYQLYGVKPSYLLDFNFFRDIGTSLRTPWGASVVNPHTLGYIALASLAFRLMDSKCFFKRARLYTICICLFSFIIVILSGARQTLVCYIIVFFIGFNRKINITPIGKLLLLISMLSVFLIIVPKMGSEHMNRSFSFQRDDVEIAYILHRDINTPLSIVKEGGVFGLGFGGYLERTGRGYPHNLLIEILTEYGLVGTIIIVIISFLIINNNGYSIFTYKTVRGGPLILIFIIFFLASMISGDLASNISVFAILFCCVIPKKLTTYKLERGLIFFKKKKK